MILPLKLAIYAGGGILLAALFWLIAKYKEARLLEQIRQQWSKPVDRKRKPRVAEAYFNLKESQCDESAVAFRLDERTWRTWTWQCSTSVSIEPIPPRVSRFFTPFYVPLF